MADDEERVNNEESPTLNEIELFLRNGEIPITKLKKVYDSCRHFHVILDSEKHQVECRDCHKWLDPFVYLTVLANEWESRRYQDTEAIKAYRQLEIERKQRVTRGLVFAKPTYGDGAICWDLYFALYNKAPFYILKSRSAAGGWYACEEDGGQISVDYLKLELARKQRKLNNDMG